MSKETEGRDPALIDEDLRIFYDEVAARGAQQDALMRERAVNADRKLLAGVVAGVTEPVAEADVLYSFEDKPSAEDLENYCMQVVSGVPIKEVEQYYRDHPRSAGASPDDEPVELTQQWQQPVRVVLIDAAKPLFGTGTWREALGGTQVNLDDGDRVLYWRDDRSGVYVVRPGDWELAPDPIRQHSAWSVGTTDDYGMPTFVIIEDEDAAELRIVGTYRVQLSPILRRVGFAPRASEP